MEVNKKELKEQEIRTLFITPALQRKGWAVSVNTVSYTHLPDGTLRISYKQLNENAVNDGINTSKEKDIRTLLYFCLLYTSRCV